MIKITTVGEVVVPEARIYQQQDNDNPLERTITQKGPRTALVKRPRLI